HDRVAMAHEVGEGEDGGEPRPLQPPRRGGHHGAGDQTDEVLDLDAAHEAVEVLEALAPAARLPPVEGDARLAAGAAVDEAPTEPAHTKSLVDRHLERAHAPPARAQTIGEPVGEVIQHRLARSTQHRASEGDLLPQQVPLGYDAAADAAQTARPRP